MSKTRDSLIDILKGIGIVSVVIGHSGVLFPGGEFIPSIEFVYLYHLMLFFFTAGAVYSPKKYPDPYVYIGRQLKGSLTLYWGYNFFFLALHNLFSSADLLNIPMLSLGDYAINIAGIFIFTHLEQLGGALWFVPMLLVAKMLFSIAFQTAEKCKYKIFAHAVVVCSFAALGLYTNHWGMYFTYHIQTSFLGIPIIYLGYLFNSYRKNVLKFANIYTCVLSAALMWWFLSFDIGSVELSVNSIISPILFYPITILGLFFCVSLGRVIQCSGKLTGLFSYFGAISFHLMALHFLAFKCFDWLYGLILGLDFSAVAEFPTALGNLGLLYTLIGIGVPMILVEVTRKCVLMMRKKTIQNSILSCE